MRGAVTPSISLNIPFPPVIGRSTSLLTEDTMKLLMTACATLVLMAGGLPAQEAQKGPRILRGTAIHDPKLEGGVWTLKFEGKVYDLHGDLSGCSSGDRVEIEGMAEPGKACVHMVGIVFRVAKVKVLESQERREQRPAR
jgi:hypothetical protein